jgi:hypothetical protein
MNSYILNFKIKSKTFFILSITILQIIFLIILIAPLLFPKEIEHPDLNLVKYQINKIKSNNYTTIFLGDSGLGNALDAKEWERISGSKTVNLALTGNASFSGDLYLLNKVNLKNIKNVYIVHNPDVWVRKTAITNKYLDFIKEPTEVQIKNFFYKKVDRQIIKSKLFLKYFFLSIQIQQIKNDYIEQLPTKEKKDAISNDLIINNIELDQLESLKNIFLLCKKNNLNCLYLNAPVHEKFCHSLQTKNFINYINNILYKSDINFKHEILCIKNYQQGDFANHLGYKYKKEFTMKYFNIIKE